MSAKASAKGSKVPENQPAETTTVAAPGVLDARSLQAVAAELFHSGATYSEKIARILGFLHERTGGISVYLFQGGPSAQTLELERTHPEPGASEDRTALAAAKMGANQALKSGLVQLSNLAKPDAPTLLLTCAVEGPDRTAKALSLQLPNYGKPAVDAALVLLQWMAEGLRLMLWRASDAARMEELDKALANAAALPELLSHASQAIDLPHALHMLVNELNHWLGSGHLILARWRFNRCKVVAMSGSVDISKRGDVHQTAELVLQNAIKQKRAISWIAGAAQEREVSPYLGELEQYFGAKQFLAAPLVSENGQVQGAWLVIWKHEQPPPAPVLQFLTASNPHVAAHLRLLTQGKPGPMIGTALRMWKKATANQKRAVRIGAGLLALILLWPASYRVSATCELEPVVRRVVAAPFESILRKSYVKGGQTVAQNELLAEMDGKEVRWRLAEVIAKQARATKQSEKATTDGEIAQARMAELEAAGLDEERKLLEYRRDHLEVRAPIAGVVLSGDLERSEGIPLKTGDPLFEIAPLDQILVEIWVEPNDIALMKEGFPVDIRLESEPGRLWRAKVTRVAPRSEMRGQQSVFVCEAVVSDATRQLRPGIKGRAKVYASRMPLIWNLTRKAWNYLRLKLW